MITPILFALTLGCGSKYTDNDNDGFYNSDDCDDNNPNVNINGVEICNGIDDDCDGKIDILDPDLEPDELLTLYNDNDGDGYGGLESIQLCELEAGYVEESNDCDDSNADINPGTDELCNGIDDNCNDLVDDDDLVLSASNFSGYYLDNDSDTFGGSEQPNSCAQLANAVTNSDDCNDNVAGINPSATEVCNGIDMDCDGLDDNEDPDIDPASLYTIFSDSDGDGYGDPATETTACEILSGHVEVGSDCDDQDATVNPGAPEVCDGVNNDCDPNTTEAGLVSRWTNGVLTDETADAAAASGTAPHFIDVNEPTTFHVCEGTHNLYISASDDLTVQGFGNAVLTGSQQHTIIEMQSVENNVEIHLQDLQIIDSSQTLGAVTINGDGALNTLLTVDNSTFNGNGGYVGGAILTIETDLMISNSVFNGNGALGAGAVYFNDSDATFDNVTFDGNLAASGGAMAFIDSTVELNNTYFINNQADNGVISVEQSTLTCNGSTSSNFGFHSNIGPRTGIFMDQSSDFTANDCDFGELSASENNEGIDINYGDFEYYAGDDANFTCTFGECGSDTQATIAAANNYANPTTCPFDSEMIGAVFTIQGTPTINSYSMDINDYVPCPSETVTAEIFKENQSGGWDSVWSGSYTFVLNNPSVVSSGEVGKAFEDGDRIALVFYGNLRMNYGYETNVNPRSYSGFGTWYGDRITGLYCTSNCSNWGTPFVQDLIISGDELPALEVSVTNLP